MNLDVMAILVVHAAIAVLYALLRGLSGSMVRRGFLGYYLVLMPLGFIVWSDPALWYTGVMSVAGLILITRAARPIVV